MRRTRRSRRSKELVSRIQPDLYADWTNLRIDAKAKAELAKKAAGSKGPLNTGSQGIKKSGKK
jgi:hypothetical protein